MGQLVLSIKYAKNTGLVYNSTELKNLYFSGIALTDQFGNPIPEETIDFYIEAAQKELSDQLSIKLSRQCVYETKDFVRDDYIQWGYMPVNYPAVRAISVQGFLNSSLQVNYPQQWLSTKNGSDPDLFWRSINLVAITGPSVGLSSNAVFVGITPYLGMLGNKTIPNYWALHYMTGFTRIPADILNYIGRSASVNLFINLGDIVLGVGVANKSISIDGLSQSIGSTASAMYSLFSARIVQYQKDMARQIDLLRARYSGIFIGSL